MLKKDYLIVSLASGYYEQMYRDVACLDNVHLCQLMINKNTSILVRIYLKLYRVCPWLPFKNYYYKIYSKVLGIPCKKYDIMLFQMDILNDSNIGLLKFLKNKYPNAKCVLHFCDLIRSRNGNLNLDNLKYFDRIYHFDKNESEKYGFDYQPTFMSPLYLNKVDIQYKSDVFFCGHAKNRYKQLLTLYDYFEEKGYNCKFIICNLPEHEKEIRRGIQYIESYLPYIEVLKYVQSTNILIEIMPNNAVGYTLRTWEAILYSKKLLTNNMSIINAPFYNDKQIICFENLNDINSQKLKSELNESIKWDVTPLSFFGKLEKIV